MAQVLCWMTFFPETRGKVFQSKFWEKTIPPAIPSYTGTLSVKETLPKVSRHSFPARHGIVNIKFKVDVNVEIMSFWAFLFGDFYV